MLPVFLANIFEHSIIAFLVLKAGRNAALFLENLEPFNHWNLGLENRTKCCPCFWQVFFEHLISFLGLKTGRNAALFSGIFFEPFNLCNLVLKTGGNAACLPSDF